MGKKDTTGKTGENGEKRQRKGKWRKGKRGKNGENGKMRRKISENEKLEEGFLMKKFIMTERIIMHLVAV